jgi:hypothetical protein
MRFSGQTSESHHSLPRSPLFQNNQLEHQKQLQTPIQGMSNLAESCCFRVGRWWWHDDGAGKFLCECIFSSVLICYFFFVLRAPWTAAILSSQPDYNGGPEQAGDHSSCSILSMIMIIGSEMCNPHHLPATQPDAGPVSSSSCHRIPKFSLEGRSMIATQSNWWEDTVSRRVGTFAGSCYHILPLITTVHHFSRQPGCYRASGA